MTLRLPDDLHAELKLLAAARGLSLQKLVLAALEADVERQQEDQATAAALDRLRQLRSET